MSNATRRMRRSALNINPCYICEDKTCKKPTCDKVEMWRADVENAKEMRKKYKKERRQYESRNRLVP